MFVVYTEDMKTWAKSGFTVVELVIVIVVIGILATITIVSYKNVQKTARATAIISGIETVKEAFNLASTKQNLGTWPLDTELNGVNNPYLEDVVDPATTVGTVTDYGRLLRGYLPALPKVNGLALKWQYDHDSGANGSRAVGVCGGAWSGVSLAIYGVPADIVQEIDKTIDDGDTTCGDVMISGTAMMYQLSYAPELK